MLQRMFGVVTDMWYRSYSR